jgi:protein SCO1
MTITKRQLVSARVRAFLRGLLVALAAGISGCESTTDSRDKGDLERADPAISPGSAAAPGSGTDAAACCVEKTTASEPGSIVDLLGLIPIRIPTAQVIDQRGRRLDLASELIGTRVAAIQFIFTRCVTTCPILGNQFAEVRRRLADQMPNDFALISISVDPEYDTPARLNDWSKRQGGGPGWWLVTGPKPDFDRLLKALGASTADRQNHQSQVLVVDGATGQGLRTSGLAAAGQLAGVMTRLRSARPQTEAPALAAACPTGALDPAERYFANTPLLDQSGTPRKFYADLLQNKIVVINVFFSECNGSCVVMGNTLAKLQERLGDRLEREVRLISITVDSSRDTPRVLDAYARRYGAREGWYFLGGDKGKVDTVLKKLGAYVDAREAHNTVFLAGNMKTGLWKKVFALADTEQVIGQIDSVINDKAG